MVSPLRLPTCRFTPTCSQYAVDALTEYGLVRGSWLTTVRLAKCGPWHRGGWDPIPERARPARSRQRCRTTLTPATAGTSRMLFNWFSLDYHLLPGVGDHVGLVQGCSRFVLGPIELLRVGAVGDVPGVHPARDPVQAVRPADPHHAPDAGAAATDQGAAEEVRQGPPADGAGDAEAAEGARVQPDPGLPADAGADPGVPRAVSRAAVLQPDPGRLRSAAPVGGAEPHHWATTSSVPTDVGHFLDANLFGAPTRREHDPDRPAWTRSPSSTGPRSSRSACR